jgi:4'-phosphopantetheinyl transferase EntD
VEESALILASTPPQTIHSVQAKSLAVRLEQLLKQVLPELSDRPVASAVELIRDTGGLFPGEAALVARAVDKRKNEFSAGRRCARRALAALGCRPVPLLMGRLREPIWPVGFGGSITHDGRFAAALAYRSAAGGVSFSIDVIDLSDREAFAEIADTVRHRAEPRLCDGHAVARVFSAKEAAIKIISPALGDLIDFQHLEATETGRGFRVVAEDVRFAIDVRTFEVGDVIVSLGSAQDA